MRGAFGTAAGVVLWTAAPAAAATWVVTPATLVSAFASAHAGDTLRLVGTFGNIKLQNGNFSKVVTLDASRALFKDTLTFKYDSNVTVSGGKFDVTGGSAYNRAVGVYSSSNIAFTKSTFVGVGNQVGITMEDVTNAAVSNARFDGLHVGVSFSRVTGGAITGNRVTHAVVDGIDIADSHGITASSNTCSLGTPGPGAHPDCIQLWSVSGRPVQSDIVVTRNTATGPTQGFTSFSGGGGALRVSITHNSVTSSFPQGIACYDCVNSNVSYNNVWTLPGAEHVTNINIVGGSNNSIVGNFVHGWPVPVKKAPTMASALSFDRASAASARFAGVNGVPEPTTWAMLLAGFGAIGIAARRGRCAMPA